MRDRAILIGAAADIREFVRRTKLEAAWNLKLVGCAPTAPAKAAKLAGINVLGAAEELFACASLPVAANYVILVSPPAGRDEARARLDWAVRGGAALRLADLQAPGVAMRKLALGDLVGAPVGDVEWEKVRALIAGRRILVTGGGGSIGGELVRRIAALAPAHLSVIENSEYNLFQIEQVLAALPAAPPRRLRSCDIRDGASLQRIFETDRPDIVFHAAAMKHVPLVEANASEGALTNVLGARNVADAAGRVGAHLIFVSTDKAANPASVMGCTKRLGELYCQALDREAAPGGPRRICVRLGNVLGSAGSVAPVFEAQLQRGEPLTVTHADVTRFFITIGQAADMLLQAAVIGLSDDHIPGATLVLDMGEPMAVADLARDMIRLAGKRPDEEVAIRFVGLRPGEKLIEELVAADEWEAETSHQGVVAVQSPPVSLAEIARRFDMVIAAARAGSDDSVRRLVHAMAAPAEARRADARQAG